MIWSMKAWYLYKINCILCFTLGALLNYIWASEFAANSDDGLRCVKVHQKIWQEYPGAKTLVLRLLHLEKKDPVDMMVDL